MERKYALAAAATLGVIEMFTSIAFGITNPVLGILFALVLPGYTVSSALFASDRLTATERILLSVGLSMAITVLGGILLNLLPWGLSTPAWGALLGAVTVLGAALAVLRRGSPGSSLSPDHVASSADTYFRLWLVRWSMGIGALLVAAAFILTIASIRNTASSGFTQFWMLPPASSYSSTIQVGVRSHELGVRSYTVKIVASGQEIQTWTDIKLTPGQSWSGSLVLPERLIDSLTPVSVQAILYRDSTTVQPYRHAQIWVDTRKQRGSADSQIVWPVHALR